jgi:quinol monooxygenase YgiN
LRWTYPNNGNLRLASTRSLQRLITRRSETRGASRCSGKELISGNPETFRDGPGRGGEPANEIGAGGSCGYDSGGNHHESGLDQRGNIEFMQHVLIIHEVADYPAWKKVFDDAAEIRREAGERSYQVLKYQNDPNRIVHFSAWTSIDDARSFFESPKLVKIRAEAGVKSPEFIYLEQLEAGTL